MRHAICVLALAALAASCVTSGGEGGTTAQTGAAGPVVSGGAVGATCPKEDQIGCAPGAKAKVRCKGGAWAADGPDCEAGKTCVETKNGSDVTATQCTIPATGRVERAKACAKASACLKDVSFGECMNPDAAQIAAFAKVFPALDPGDAMRFMVDAQLACIGTATDCKAVRDCVKGSGLECAASTASKCQGTTVVYCDGGQAVAADCGKVGLPCSEALVDGQKEAVCGKFSACAAPKTFTCQGTTAKVCTAIGPGAAVAIDIGCGYLGASCDPAGKFDNDPDVCAFPGSETCDSATFNEKCEGNTAVECASGKVRRVNCAGIGRTCRLAPTATVTPSGGSPPPPSPTSASCTATPAACSDSYPTDSKLLVFCDGNAGWRTFDCTLAGMEFTGASACKFKGSTGGVQPLP